MKSTTVTRESGPLRGEGEASLDLDMEEERLHNEAAARKKSQRLRRGREEPQTQRWPPTPRRDDDEGGTSTEPSPPGLRQIKRRASQSGIENGDVENGHRRRGDSPRKFDSQPRGRRASASSDASSPSSFSSFSRDSRDFCSGPDATSWEILRKIRIAILTDLDDETLRREDAELILVAITLVKEAILGVLIAFAIVSLCLFLNHHFSMKLPTARNMRRATSHLLVNQETLSDLEESSGWTIMTENQHNEYLTEIEKSRNKKLYKESIFKEWSRDLDDKRAVIVRAGRVYHQLKTDVGLDLYCEACMYLNQVSCADRAARLSMRYKIPPIKARLAVMQRASCRNYPPGQQGERRRRETQGVFDRMSLEEVGVDLHDVRAAAERVAETWYMYVDNFCPECAWSDGVTCYKRAIDLRSGGETTKGTEEAMARVLVESPQCRNDHYERKIEEKGGFCGECRWGNTLGRSCAARVEYLMEEYRIPEYVAQLSAMDRPTCTGKG